MPVEELKEKQEKIYSIIYPACTIMDMTIGAALWFAARGKGILIDTNEEYTSQVKIILSGLGADEQLAGYGRHRSAFNHRGYTGLNFELEKDLYRLWKRNLGRDDRIISDHGREVRFPFLDEQVIKYLHTVPLYTICNLNEPLGFGDKKLLRQLGKSLGLENSHKLAKRAIQFGSRVGKVFFPSRSNKIDGTSLFVLQQNNDNHNITLK